MKRNHQEDHEQVEKKGKTEHGVPLDKEQSALALVSQDYPFLAPLSKFDETQWWALHQALRFAMENTVQGLGKLTVSPPGTPTIELLLDFCHPEMMSRPDQTATNVLQFIASLVYEDSFNTYALSVLYEMAENVDSPPTSTYVESVLYLQSAVERGEPIALLPAYVDRRIPLSHQIRILVDRTDNSARHIYEWLRNFAHSHRYYYNYGPSRPSVAISPSRANVCRHGVSVGFADMSYFQSRILWEHKRIQLFTIAQVNEFLSQDQLPTVEQVLSKGVDKMKAALVEAIGVRDVAWLVTEYLTPITWSGSMCMFSQSQ